MILDSVKRLPRSARNSQNVLSAKCAVRGVLEVSQHLKLELLERLGGAAPLKSEAMDLKSWPHPLKSAPTARVPGSIAGLCSDDLSLPFGYARGRR